MAVSADSLRLGVSREVTPGTPSTDVYDLIRTTGEGLIFEVATTQSTEMGGINRGVKDNILTGATVTGEIAFELSKNKAFEELLVGLLASKWGPDYWTAPWEGDADETYDYQDFQTFTIEKRFTLDDTPTYAYHGFSGCMVDTLSISITPNEPITGSYGFIGNEMTTNDAELGSSYVQAGTEPVMTAPLVTGIELLYPPGMDDTTGDPLGSPVSWSTNGCFTGLDMNFSNNGRGLQCIGYLGNKETSLGRFEVTGTGSLYYAGDQPLDALIDQTEFALRVVTTDASGNSYTWFFPRVVFSEASVLASGTNTDVMTEFTMQMLEWQGDIYANTAIINRLAGGALLTFPVDDADGQTASTGSVATDTNTGTLYYVVTTSAVTPSFDQIVAGTDEGDLAAAFAGNQVVSTTGVQTIAPAPTGLTAGTGYWTHFVQDDGTGFGVPVSASGFTTDP